MRAELILLVPRRLLDERFRTTSRVSSPYNHTPRPSSQFGDFFRTSSIDPNSVTGGANDEDWESDGELLDDEEENTNDHQIPLHSKVNYNLEGINIQPDEEETDLSMEDDEDTYIEQQAESNTYEDPIHFPRSLQSL